MSLRRTVFSRTLVLGVMALFSSVPWAQSPAPWPDKPVKLILSQPPGSGPDNVARLLGERLAKPLGQAVVIENKPGGQNVIGAQRHNTQHQVAHHLGVSTHLNMTGTEFILEPRIATLCA